MKGRIQGEKDRRDEKKKDINGRRFQKQWKESNKRQAEREEYFLLNETMGENTTRIRKEEEKYVWTGSKGCIRNCFSPFNKGRGLESIIKRLEGLRTKIIFNIMKGCVRDSNNSDL